MSSGEERRGEGRRERWTGLVLMLPRDCAIVVVVVEVVVVQL